MTPRDPLDDLLDRWPLPAKSVPDLRPEIRRELARLRPAERGGWWARLDLAFGRPSFAVTFVVACILLGLFLAEARIATLHAQYGAQVARSYIQLIDPLLGSQPTPAAKEAR